MPEAGTAQFDTDLQELSELLNILATSKTPAEAYSRSPTLLTDTLRARGALPITVPEGVSIFDPQGREGIANASDGERRRYAATVAELLGEPWSQEKPVPPSPPPKQEKGLLKKVLSPLGGILAAPAKPAWDVADEPVGKLFDMLNYPSDRFEHIPGFIGLALESPHAVLQDPSALWEAALMTNETAFSRGGEARRREIYQRVHGGEDIQDILDQRTEAEILKDAIIKIPLDPLNLFAFIGLLKGGKGAGIAKVGLVPAVARRLDAGITALPGPVRSFVTRIGYDPVDEILDTARRQTLEGDLIRQATGEVGQGRKAGWLWRATPQARTSEALDNIEFGIYGALKTADHPDLLFQVGDALRAGDEIPGEAGRFWRSGVGGELGRLMRQNDLDFREIKAFQKPVYPGGKRAWDLLDEAEQATFYPDKETRLASVMREVLEPDGAWTKRIKQTYATEYPVPEWANQVDRLISSIKPWLSMFTLNTPGFVQLNVMGHLAMAAVQFGPKGLMPSTWALRQAERMTNISAEPVETILRGNATFYREGAGMFKGWGRYFSPLVELAGKVDRQAARGLMAHTIMKAWRHNWRFVDEGGIVPDLPEEVAQALGPETATRLRGAVLGLRADGDSLRNLLDGYGQNRLPPTVAGILERKALREGWDEARTAEESGRLLNSPLHDVVNDILREESLITASRAAAPVVSRTFPYPIEGDTAFRTAGRIRKLQDDLLRDVHEMRDYDGLAPFARGVLTKRAGVDIDALSRQMEKAQGETLERLMRAYGFSADEQTQVIGELGKGFATIGKRRVGIWNSIYDADEGFQTEHLAKWRAYWPWRAEQQDVLRKTVVGNLAKKSGELADKVDGLLRDFGRVQNDVDNHLRQVLQQSGNLRTTDFVLSTPGSTGVHNLFQAHLRYAEGQYAAWRNDWFTKMGFETGPGKYALAGEYPMVGEVVSVTNIPWVRFLDDVVDDLPNMLTRTPPSTDDAARLGVKAYLDNLPGLMTDATVMTEKSARLMYDFGIINYRHKRGFDLILPFLYPYHYWPTRAMHRWLRITMGRPGTMAAVAKVTETREELNRDMPQRLKHTWRVPIPGLSMVLPEWTDDNIYVDPLQMAFPLAQRLATEQFDQDAQGPLGHFLEFSQKIGPGFAPWVRGPLAMSGILGDWDVFVGSQMGSLPFGLPGQKAERAIRALQHEGTDTTGILDDETIANFALGRSISGDALRGLLDLPPGEKWDAYRAARMAVALTFQRAAGLPIDQKRELYVETLRQIKAGDGPLWEEAVSGAETEYGLRVLTGWALGAQVNLYAKGEDYMRRAYPESKDVERGLDEMYALWRDHNVARGEPGAIQDFYAVYPEYRIKDISTSVGRDTEMGTQDTLKEVDRNLYFIDRELVNKKYEQSFQEIAGEREFLERAGGMRTKEGRTRRELLQSDYGELLRMRQRDFDEIGKRYPYADFGKPSYGKTAGERALQQLVNLYYEIEPEGAEDGANALRLEQRRFLEALPTKDTSQSLGAKLRLDLDAERTRMEYDRRIAANPRETARLIDERNAKLDGIAAQYLSYLTRDEFDAWRRRNQKPPTPEYEEYRKASQEMSQFMALVESAGVGQSRAEQAMLNAYKLAHPLIQKYYGERIDVRLLTMEQRIAKVKMDGFWDSYYANAAGQERRDYLILHMEDLNTNRGLLGLRPLRLRDYRPGQRVVSLDGGPQDIIQRAALQLVEKEPANVERRRP